MPDTIWCYDQKEKSLDVMSRDFFASGKKTLVLLPLQEKVFNNDFHRYVSFFLENLAKIGQQITVIGAGRWQSVDQVFKSTGSYTFEAMPSFKVKRKDFMGRYTISEDALPTLEKAGMISNLLDCDNVVLIGCLHGSSRFGTTAVMSLVENVLPTFTLAQAYMLNQNDLMCRAFGEIIHSKLYPKVGLSVVYNEKGVTLGKDMVAVESAALYNSGLNIRSSRLLLESARLGFGDIFFSSSNIVGSYQGARPGQMPRTGSIPKWIRQNCNFCMECINICPNGSILKNGDVLTFTRNCVRCGTCADLCNQSALV